MKSFIYESNWFPVLCIVLFLAIIVASFFYLTAPTLDRVDWERTTYTVQMGDSLWSISGRYCPDNVDRREWIGKVQKINRLDSSIIHVGERLTIIVPAED
jgi:hypothetical protein